MTETRSARKPSASRVAESAHWQSSTTSPRGREAAISPRALPIASYISCWSQLCAATGAPSSGRSMASGVWSPGFRYPLRMAARSTALIGAYSRPGISVAATSMRSRALDSSAVRASAVLPAPASPPMSTRLPLPSRALSASAASRASSDSRPMSWNVIAGRLV